MAGTSNELPPLRALISNGFGKFPLAGAAAGLHRLGIDVHLLMGAYPTQALSTLLERSPVRPPDLLRRLAGRRESIPSECVTGAVAADILNQVAVRAASRRISQEIGLSLQVCAMSRYANKAAAWLQHQGGSAGVYHYRSGFGTTSCDKAERLGLTLLCDQSIAHPRLIEHLVAAGGAIPDESVLPGPTTHPVWRLVDQDLRQADHILANSGFVRETCIRAGIAPDDISVIYHGVEDDVLRLLDAEPRPARPGGHASCRILYAGRIEQRKGIATLARLLALEPSSPWSLTLVGSWDPDALHLRKQFDADPRVTHIGYMGRLELARMMLEADIFMFPSLAEGSARVVGMAMAAGCFVVVTPNTGSFMRDGIDGVLVPPNDPVAIASVLDALSRDPERVRTGGNSGARYVREQYRHTDYARNLLAVYRQIIGRPRLTEERA